MRLVVKHRNGELETLTLVPPISVRLGDLFNIVHDASGMDYYFYPEDGFYDGWGMAGDMTTEQANAVIERVEESREIERGEQ